MIINKAKLNVTIDELKKRIDDFKIIEAGESVEGLYAFIWNDQTQFNLKRSGVRFGCENYTDCEDMNDEDEQFRTPGFRAGYELIKNMIPVRWVAAGNDSDMPVCFCVYINAYDELDVYVPCNGNDYNKKESRAYYYGEKDKLEYNQDKMRKEFFDYIQCKVEMDIEYHVGYDDYKVKDNEMKFFTVICNTFDKLKDAERYMREQQKRMPDKSLWIQIKRKEKNNDV